MASLFSKTAQVDAAIPPMAPMEPSGGSTPVHIPARSREYRQIRRNSEMTPQEQLSLYTSAYKQAGEPVVKEAASNPWRNAVDNQRNALRYSRTTGQPAVVEPPAPVVNGPKGRVGDAYARDAAAIDANRQAILARAMKARAASRAYGVARNTPTAAPVAPKRIVKQSPDTAQRNAEWLARRQAQKAQQAALAKQNARYAAFGLGPGRLNTPNNQIAGK